MITIVRRATLWGSIFVLAVALLIGLWGMIGLLYAVLDLFGGGSLAMNEITTALGHWLSAIILLVCAWAVMRNDQKLAALSR